MLRTFYLLSIIFCIVLFIISGLYMGKVAGARSYNSYSYNSYEPISYDDDHRDEDLTIEAGQLSLPFFGFFLVLAFITLIKLKTKIMKVLSIIGLILCSGMILWALVMMDSPGGVSFDETGGGWIFFTLVQLAFSIVGTVHAFRKKA
jgi:hypothetical protein